MRKKLEYPPGGLARKNPHLPNRALPITPQIFLDMFSMMDTSKPNDAIIWCAFLFMFFLMHTGKCIRRFADIYAYCRYFIDPKW